MRSCHPRFHDDPTTAAYVTNLESLISDRGPLLWVHGHTHHCVDYQIEKTRVVSNQRGYPDEPVEGFDAAFTVAI